MSRIIIISTIFISFLLPQILLSQDVILRTQADVDAFDTDIYVINGTLEINGLNSSDPITNLSHLSNITTINKDLTISTSKLNSINNLSSITFIKGNINIFDNRALTNINGLKGLTSFMGFFTIEFNDALTNVDGLSGLKSVTGELEIKGNNVLTNIDGLSGIMSIDGDLFISGNDELTNVDGLSGLKSVTGELEIESNSALSNINGLSGLNSIAGTLDIRENNVLTNIDGLSGITSIDGDLFISGNDALTNVDGLSGLKSVTGELDFVSNSALSNINGLSGLESIKGYLYLRNNDELTNIDGLSGLKSLEGLLSISENDKLTNIDGLSGVKSVIRVAVSSNKILTNVDGLSGLTSINGFLWIDYNDALTNIDGLSGIEFIGNKLSISNNPALTDCCGIQHLIYKYGPNSTRLLIKNNPSECSSTEEIKTSRCFDYDYVEGKANYDSDSDGCDSIDVSIPNIKIRMLQNSDNDYVISDKSGDYRYFLREAGEIVLLPEYDNKLFKIEPDTVIINYPADSLNLVHDFCVSAIKNFNDLKVVIIPTTQARPGFSTLYEISYKNKGTNIISGSIELCYNNTFATFKSAEPVESDILSDTIKWYYNDLMPYEQRKIIVKFKLSNPTDNPPVNGGDLLTYAAKIYPVVEDITNWDNSFRLNQTVVNSLDPNDKTCLDGDEFDVQKVGDYVNYLIRFENKGTAETVNIKVVDVIDTSLFDISTLEITSSSHNCFTNIYKDIVEFLFEHIFLDFHDDKNDGFIAFKIRTRPTLESGTILKNTANIYFDYNLPVKTNVATTIVKEIVATKETDTGSWQIFPNPSAGSFYIGTDRPGNYSVTLYDTYGKAVYNSTKEIRNLTELQYYTLPSGLYFLKIENKGELFHNEKVLIFR